MEQNTNTAIKVHGSTHEQNHRTLAAILTELRSLLGLADGQSVVEEVRALVEARRAESALTDDANAFRLEADLRLDVEWGAASVTVGGCAERYSHGDDPRAAKRRAIARAAALTAAPTPSQAPAVPSGWKLVPVEPTDAMVQAAHHIDLSYMPGQEGADRAAVYRAMLTAAPTPPAQPKCLTCNGHGLIGGHMQDGSGYGEGCPDCNPEPAVPESADGGQPAQTSCEPRCTTCGATLDKQHHSMCGAVTAAILGLNSARRRLRSGNNAGASEVVERVRAVLSTASPAVPESADTPPAQPASAPAAMNADLMQEAKTAIELAMDNLRSHGDNCFLHDDGEYDACFCGLDSLSDYLQSTVEAIEGAISAPAAEQPAVPSVDVTPEMLRAAQMRTELGAYACANMSSAYTLITELFQNMLAASPACGQPAVPEDVAREPMAEKWCWWIGDAETFHVADTESEAHSEAQSRIDDDCEPGGTHEYSVGRVQHPIDALGMEWLAEHAAETIEENACCWCDDNTGAEDPSITLAAEDKQALGTMVAAFLREKAAVHWWTADQKTITTHTHVAGSAEGGDAARAAEKGGAA